MRIAVDGFGGDNAPLSVLQGSAMAVAEYGVEILMTGKEEVIKKTAAENNISLNGITIVNTEDVIEVCDDPTSILKEHKDSSMGVGMRLLVEGKADAFVSAGSTGAIVVGSSLIVKRIRGIKRVAIAPVIPSATGCYMLIDSGANVECRPEMLVQFATMGSVYMKKLMKVENPRVGLANIGEEETKGTDLQKEAYKQLKATKLNFVGNVEARDIPLGKADVVVCDGFTGNIILKLTEGLAKFLMGGLKDIFKGSFKNKIAAMLIMKDMKKFKSQLDYKEYGGTLVMGATKPVIKAHGSSDGYAYKNAIRQAKEIVEQDVIGEINRALQEQKEANE